MKTNRPLFYGIPAIYFIWHGEWSDPEISYRGHVVNYYEVEDHFWHIFNYENPGANEDDFDKWIKGQAHEVKEFILDMVA